jgi:hypothetical protein
MIQPLRAVHRRAFGVLALVLPMILLIGIGARPPHVDVGANATDLPGTGNVVSESGNLWQRHSIRSMFRRKPDRPLDTYVVLLPAQELNEPDLLLYWAANPPQGNVVPGDAQLLGAYRTGKAFLLPWSEKGAGYLFLFSPAHQTVFDTAALEKLP